MGKSSSPTIGFWYGLTMHMGLCNGPIDAILEIRGDDKPMFPGYTIRPTYNENNIMLEPPSGATQPAITGSGTTYISASNLYGGEKQEGGVSGQLTVLMGEIGQMPASALADIEHGSRPAYRGICTAVFTGLVAAMSPYIKPWNFRVSRYLMGWNTPVWHPELVKIDRGMNGAHIIYQCLTDPVWSASEDGPQDIDEASFLACATTLFNEGFGLCLKWSTQDKVGDFIGVVLNHIAALRFIDPVTNRVGLRLLRGDYDVAAMALDPSNILDENDIVEMTGFQPPALDESVNEVVVTYHDVATHKDASVAYQNLANVQAQGKVVSQSVTYDGAWNGDIAGRLAARDCHTKSALLTTGECRVKSTRWADLKVGDIKLLNWAREKCVLMPIRVLKVNSGDATARTIVVSWAQDEFGVPASTYIVPVPTQWQEPNHAPQPITNQLLMEAPYRELARTLDPANLNILDADVGFLMSLAARPAAGASYNYHLATKVGAAAYADRGPGDFINGGQLDANITESTTSVTLTGSDDLSRIRLLTAALIGTEIVRIDALDATTGGVTLGRGCADTVPVAHAAGARLWFYQGFVGADRTDYVSGETVDAKLLTVAAEGMLSLSQATTISQTMAQRQARPYPPGNLTINSLRYPTAVVQPLVLAWSHRDRLLQADQLVDTLQSNVGPESGTTYTVRVYLSGALDSTTTGIAGTTLTPTVSGFGTVRIEIDAVRDGIASFQALKATFGLSNTALALTGDAPDGTTGVPYSYTYTSSGGLPPIAYSLVAAPSWMTIANPAVPTISGTPTNGPASWSIRATDSVGTIVNLADSASFNYATLNLTGTFAPVIVGSSYSSDIAISGGDGSYSLTGGTGVSSGSLPVGLVLSVVGSSLRLSGTPTGSSGTDSFTASVDSGDGQTATSAQSVVVSVPAVTTAWRVLIAATNGNANASIAELEFRATSGGGSLCTGGTSSASSSYPGGGFNVSNAFDGSPSTRWAANGGAGFPCWIEYLLPTSSGVNEISIQCSNTADTDQPKDFTIQSSVDGGSTWVDEWSVSGQTSWTVSEIRVFTRP